MLQNNASCFCTPTHLDHDAFILTLKYLLKMHCHSIKWSLKRDSVSPLNFESHVVLSTSLNLVASFNNASSEVTIYLKVV